LLNVARDNRDIRHWLQGSFWFPWDYCTAVACRDCGCGTRTQTTSVQALSVAAGAVAAPGSHC
jgi:hypothetical protein